MRISRVSLGDVAPPVFTDVPADHPWRPAIEWMKARGISNGCETDKFCPDRELTRGEMAVFLYRALGQSSGGGPAAPTAGPDPVASGLTIFGQSVSPWAAGGAVLLLLALVARK